MHANGVPDPEEAELEKMIGQMIMVGFRGAGQADKPYIKDYRRVLSSVALGRVGGVILFNRDHSSGSERNIQNPAQLAALCADLQTAAPLTLFIAVDQEGGRVRRLTPAQGFLDLPAPADLGKLSAAEVRGWGLKLGRELRSLGINVDFAPSLDVNINPHSPAIGALGRSFGADAVRVAELGGAFRQGLEEAGVIGAYKHFPGHGSASTDTHVEFTDISASWQPSELEPYKSLLRKNGPYMVMLGHVFHKAFDPALPASLSPRVGRELLRGQLDWQGVIISDDLQMQAIRGRYSLEETILLAVEAGNDILLFGNNLEYDLELPEQIYQTLLRLCHEGKISRERIRGSYERIMRLKDFIQ